jgi:hypothetical protein
MIKYLLVLVLLLEGNNLFADLSEYTCQLACGPMIPVTGSCEKKGNCNDVGEQALQCARNNLEFNLSNYSDYICISVNDVMNPITRRKEPIKYGNNYITGTCTATACSCCLPPETSTPTAQNPARGTIEQSETIDNAY